MVTPTSQTTAGLPMTLLQTSSGLDTTNQPDLEYEGRAVAPDPTADATEAGTWGWAVVEIRSDGTWGQPQVVPADGRPAAVATAAAATPPVADRLQELSPTIEAHVGSAHVSNGCLQQAVTAFTRGTRARVPLPARDDCLARLAHAEALQGDLRRASRHASLSPDRLGRRTRPAREGLDRPRARGLRGDAPATRPGRVAGVPTRPRPLVDREPAAGRGTTARSSGPARRRDSSAGGGP